ncbi:MAG: MlaD family protein [Burkholderiaceae bacterium]
MNAEPTSAQVPKNVEFRAALLLILLALLVGASALYVMYARGVFEDTNQLVLLAEDSEGVFVGMDMTFSGFPIGRVRRIELAKGGGARIVVEVPTDDWPLLRVSSVFTLTRGLVGGSNLRAFTGIPDDAPLPDGAERKVLIGDATAEIPRLVADARELMKNLTALSSPDSAIATSLANLQSVTEQLKTRGALGVLLGDEANSKKLISALDRTNSLLARVDSLAAKADAQVFGKKGVMPEAREAIVQINGALNEARASLKKVDAILTDAQAIAGNAKAATNDLDVLRAEIDTSLRKVEGMIDQLNRRWPFSRQQEIKLP